MSPYVPITIDRGHKFTEAKKAKNKTGDTRAKKPRLITRNLLG